MIDGDNMVLARLHRDDGKSAEFITTMQNACIEVAERYNTTPERVAENIGKAFELLSLVKIDDETYGETTMTTMHGINNLLNSLKEG